MPPYGQTLVLALALGGWCIVALVVAVLPVTPSTQAIFYAALFAAITGTWALVREVYRLRRPPARDLRLAPTGAIHFLGSGMRFAAGAEFALWLQSLRMLTPVYIALVIVSYLALEYLFRPTDSAVN